MKEAYAGIGSRETPNRILTEMSMIARWLGARDYILRSGGADGADTAFEEGAAAKEIFVPWRGFNSRFTGIVLEGEIADASERIAAKFHPAWSRCSQGARKLHARNVAQVLGPDLASPSAFVVCWTKDGGPTGGTGQALRIAAHYGVPIYNLFDPKAGERLYFKLCREGVFG